MDPSTGDGNGQLITTGESVEQPKQTADSVPGSSHELKEAIPDVSNVETNTDSVQTSISLAAQEPQTSDFVEEGIIKERADGNKLHSPGVTSTANSSGTSLPPIEVANIDKNNAATETNDTCDKAVEVHDSSEQMKETGDCNKAAPEDQVHVSPQERSEKKLDDSGDAVGKASSNDYQANSTRESENFHDNTEKTNCGSPTVISSTEQSVMKNADKGSSKQDIPPTVNKEEPKVPSVVVDPENTEASTEGRSFTFHVSPSIEFSDAQASMKWLSSSTGNGSKETPIVEGSPSSSGLVSVKAQVPAHDSPGSVQTTGRKTGGGRAKAVSERKKRRTSVKGGGKGGTESGNTLKDQDLLRRPEIGGKSGVLPHNAPGIYQKLQSREIQTSKPFGFLTGPTPSLSELNDSALLTASKQPFTELQQIQLRAQILVYGSLISKLIPEEVHMMSAFGGSDGGRSMWEKAWRAYREKISRQTLNAIESENPKLTQTGEAVSTQAINKVGIQDKIASPSVHRATSKNTPSPAVAPIVPFSSSLWGLHTPYNASQPSGVPSIQHVFTPLPPNQAPLMGTNIGHSPAWTSQTHFQGSWVAGSQNSPLETGAHFPPSFNMEPVKLTPPRDTTLPAPSSMKNAFSSVIAQGEISAPSVSIGYAASSNRQKMVASPGQPSLDSKKTRKRKKAFPSAAAIGQVASQSQQKMESVSLPAVVTNDWPVVVTTMLSSGNGPEQPNLPVSQSLAGHQKAADLDLRRSVLTVETQGKVEEAGRQAEDATVSASTAVSQSQELWDQLNKQKNFGSVASTEVKLASAAVAIATAASVAKVAAAAATVASDAALQMKLMAEEALNPGMSGKTISHNNAKTSASKLSQKGDHAVKEAARSVEVASASSLQTENLNCLIKAAKLAVEAIVQAGKVVSMDDHFPLSELLNVGFDRYLESYGLASHEITKSHNMNKVFSRADGTAACGHDIPGVQPVGPSQNDEARADRNVILSNSEGEIRASAEEDMSLIDGIEGGTNHGNKVIEDTSADKKIYEGSHVEVYKDGDGYKASWLSAEVLSLKDGKAYVCYSELQSNEGSEKLKEWVDLSTEGDNAPKIRIPHPITFMQSEGTRKRRRAAIGDLKFSIGDRVDARMQDSWWEGVVTEENKQGTTVTVHFPVHEETADVQIWHLRPSLIWKDGEWIEWSTSGMKERNHHEGSMPKRKRKKVGPSVAELKGQSKVVDSANPEKSNVLNLADNDKVVDVGKGKNESKPDNSKTMRAGLRKHGSRVIFGVPKPGKTRKFMKVSKHYVEEKDGKSDEMIEDSVKLSNYLVPRVTRPRERRNNPKFESGKKQLLKANKAKILKSVTDHANLSETAEATVGKHNFTSPEEASDNEEGVHLTSETSEPRRSNRQIQPTSRLLEGLQSSLIGSKAPFTSHDRSSKNAGKITTKGK